MVDCILNEIIDLKAIICIWSLIWSYNRSISTYWIVSIGQKRCAPITIEWALKINFKLVFSAFNTWNICSHILKCKHNDMEIFEMNWKHSKCFSSYFICGQHFEMKSRRSRSWPYSIESNEMNFCFVPISISNQQIFNQNRTFCFLLSPTWTRGHTLWCSQLSHIKLMIFKWSHLFSGNAHSIEYFS